MTADRLHAISSRYRQLRLALVGDVCLDRYLEIDPSLAETSIETGLPVHNVVNVRAQPGGAGTILNNLVALGIGEIHLIGFAGQDGEGFELLRALRAKPGVRLDGFIQTPDRRTFTYCKPLLIQPGQSPRELNRLDSKNWTPTPDHVQDRLIQALETWALSASAIILLDQVDRAGTGVVTYRLLETVRTLSLARPNRIILADSRRGLRGFPPVCFKMNRAELGALTGVGPNPSIEPVRLAAAHLARDNGRPVFVTLSEDGILAASPDGESVRVPALPVRGQIDIVGAGDAVTANLAAALAAGATRREAIELANAAASVVIHQLGTTGTASVAQIATALDCT